LKRIPEAWRTRLQQSVAGFRAGLPFNFDSWDGYPAARERLYASFARAGSRPIVLSGDSHAAWANDLYDDGGRLTGTEFGTTAITSPSYGSLLPGLGQVLAQVNREVAFCDQDNKGYTLLTLTPDRASAEFVAVSTILAKPFERRVVATYATGTGTQRRPLAPISS
jgi:alkaline phosphatase D